MSLETLELDKKMQEYSISEFRNYPEYVKICEAFCIGLYSIQNAINYLSDMQNVDKAEGIWLDYLGWLVGITRSTYDILQYFCVNAEHINVEKLFYFEGSSSVGKGSLEDIYFKKRIRAKIGYNTSKTTRNENIKIIEGMINADKVIIDNAKNFDNFTEVGNPTITDGVTPTTRYTVVGNPTITDGVTPTTRYTVVGNPTITNGVASNFSTNNYLTQPNAITINDNGEFRIDFKFNCTVASSLQYIFDLYNTTGEEVFLRRATNGAYVLICFVNGTAIWQPAINTLVDNVTGYFEYKNGTYTIEINGEKRSFSSEIKMNPLTYNLSIGARLVTGTAIDACVNGSIDLNKFVISVDNVEVYRAWVLQEAGIASGLSSSNYLKTNISLGNANTWEIFVKNFTYFANTTTNYNLVVGNNNTGSLNLNLFFNEGFKSIIISFSADGTSTFGSIQFTYSAISLESNDILDIKLEFTGTAYVAKFINKNKNKEYIQTLTNSIKINNSEILIGGYRTMTGSIDLKQFSISTNGVEIYRAWEIEEEGWVSGFTTSNYLTSSNVITLSNKGEFRIDFKYKGTQATTLQNILDVYGTTGNEIVVRRNQNSDAYQCLVFVSGVAVFNVSANDTSNNITGYVEYKDGIYTFDINGAKRILASTTKPNALTYNLSLGIRLFNPSDLSPLINGSIDLKQFRIAVDNKIVYKPYTVEPMLLNIDIHGENLYYPSSIPLRDTLENILGNGVGIRNLELHP